MTDQPVHASCVALDERAILLFGRSGSGKSDLALRLIDRGWSLVADDYVDLTPRNGWLLASPPASIAGRMEVRHVGVVDLPYRSNLPVCLAILLDEEPERLPEPGGWKYAGITVPSLSIRALECSAPVKVEHLLRVYGLALK